MPAQILMFLGATVSGAAILAFFIKGNNSYGRAFFWSLLMLIGLLALIMKIFNSH